MELYIYNTSALHHLGSSQGFSTQFLMIKINHLMYIIYITEMDVFNTMHRNKRVIVVVCVCVATVGFLLHHKHYHGYYG